MKKDVYLLPLNASDKEIANVVDLLMVSEKRKLTKSKTRPIRRKGSV